MIKYCLNAFYILAPTFHLLSNQMLMLLSGGFTIARDQNLDILMTANTFKVATYSAFSHGSTTLPADAGNELVVLRISHDFSSEVIEHQFIHTAANGFFTRVLKGKEIGEWKKNG